MWIRLLAALSVLLVGGEHVLPSLHHAAVQHEICPDHGELVHRGTNSFGTGNPLDTPAVHGTSDEDSEHGHCGCLAAAPLRAPLAATLLEWRGPAYSSTPASFALVRLVAPADVLAFAPKQSPPA